MKMGIGDWGLGPIPNPQSPINIFVAFNIIFNIKIYNIYIFYKLFI